MIKYCFVLLLTGCAVSNFDSTLYDRLTVMSVDTKQTMAKCNTSEFMPALTKLSYESSIALQYVQYTSTDVNAALTLVDKDIKKVYKDYSTNTPSPAFCKYGLTFVDAEITALLIGIGGKTK